MSEHDHEPIKVKIGNDEVTIPDMMGFKAARAGTMLARANDAIVAVMDEADEWSLEYRRTHTSRITREEANFHGRTDIVFPGDEVEGRQPLSTDFIEVPRSPTEERIFMQVFKKAFELIEKELVQFLALVLAPNNELERAYLDEAGGGVDKYLEDKAQRLLFDARLGQLVDVALAARTMLEREFEGKDISIEDFRNLFRGGPPDTDQETEPTTPGLEEGQEPDTTTPTPEASQPEDEPQRSSTRQGAEQGSESGSQPSSTPSPAPTNGQGERSSSASPGTSYARSGTG